MSVIRDIPLLLSLIDISLLNTFLNRDILLIDRSQLLKYRIKVLFYEFIQKAQMLLRIRE